MSPYIMSKLMWRTVDRMLPPSTRSSPLLVGPDAFPTRMSMVWSRVQLGSRKGPEPGPEVPRHSATFPRHSDGGLL